MGDGAKRAGPGPAYPVEMGHGHETRHVPLVAGVVADLSARPAGEWSEELPPFRDITVDELPEVDRPGRGGEVSRRLRPLVAAAADVDAEVLVRVMDVAREDIAADLLRSPVVEQSLLFRRVYEEAYGTFDGAPMGLLLVDIPFSARAEDMLVLERLATIGARAGCVIVAEAGPGFLDVDAVAALRDAEAHDRLESGLSSKRLALWQAFRDKDEARFLTLTLQGTALDLGRRLVEVYGENGLWASGLLVAGASPAPTVSATDILADHGLAVGAAVGSAPLADAPTAQRPRAYHDARRRAESREMTRLLHVLAASQFLNAATCFLRDRIGAYLTVEEMAAGLTAWIQGYVATPSDGDGEGDRADPERPFRAASMQLAEVVGEPGSLDVVLELSLNRPGDPDPTRTVHTMRTVAPLGM